MSALIGVHCAFLLDKWTMLGSMYDLCTAGYWSCYYFVGKSKSAAVYNVYLSPSASFVFRPFVWVPV